MPLFHVQDADRPAFVVAKNWKEALEKWTNVVAAENDMAPADMDGPDGIAKVCDDRELIISLLQG